MRLHADCVSPDGETPSCELLLAMHRIVQVIGFLTGLLLVSRDFFSWTYFLIAGLLYAGLWRG